eukprot:gene12949-15305_t
MPTKLRLVTQLLEAVSQLHARGIVHGDIKGNNVLVAPAVDGGQPILRVIDFGHGVVRLQPDSHTC